MASIAKTVPTPARIGMAVIDVVSFVVFSLLDVLDVVLCFAYRVADFFVESEWKPCYCSSPRAAIATNGGGDILVSGQGESKIVRMMSSSKVQMEDVSDTLYARASRVSEVSSSAVKRLNSHNRRNHAGHNHKKKTGSPGARSSFVVNSTVVEMIHGRMVGQKSQPIPRWSDCDCQLCNSWSSSSSTTLYVKSAGGEGGKAREDVVFIHGFISSSAFWTETLFPNFSKEASSMYRFFAVDLLGFGRSPKPAESLYTLKEHVDMIEKSVLEPHKVKSFHIVAHSLGCILALALAVRHPNSVKSLTLLAPNKSLCLNMDPSLCDAALFSSAGGRRSDAIRDEKGRSEARVAVDHLRGVDGLLVRARQPYDLPAHMQEPPVVGISHQASHQKQAQDILGRRFLLPHPQRGVAHPPQHHLRHGREARRLPRRRPRPRELRDQHLPRQGRRGDPRGVHP
ncbi:probable lysophospholipase BODYGUARD 3 isoform X2 [Rhodamnia argentea]|uniref:Probable lysophospholipase BODYGUARD 3 isoform X2 n=1 Tax=Rhodamnia argentea TaxID=178133 RepID=A0ABM3HYC3_9MYRT|nr:probable lysophospholipase BODYGUARD 3 isoform X2 [Rhodamnia argentea]